MQSKVMSVFYGSDLLPYKDSERTVHFPIIGGAIAGSNNVTKIRFYVDQVGGTENVSWVVVSKLPNGKLGYEPISNVGIDDETGEKYLEFDLSSYYTSVKGDLYLALRGYQGDIRFEDDDDDGIYKIVGDPLIQVTGTIKLPINYSPMVNTGTQVLPTDVDKLIASLSKYLKVGDGIQIFTATITTTFAELYAKTGTKEFILFYSNTYYIGRFNSATSIYMETISRISNSKIAYSKDALSTSDRVATLFSYNNEDRVAFGKTTIWYTYGSDTTDLDHLVQDLDYNGGHDSTKPFLFNLTSSSYGYEGYYLCQADTMGYPNCSFIFREIDGNKIFKGVVNSYQTNDLRDFFNPSYLFIQTNQEYVEDEIETLQEYVDDNFLNRNEGGNVDGDVAFGGIVTVVTPTQDNEVANKGYVDNAIQEFLQNEYQAVDTTEYPTLDSFLASTGEEGYIYLYPTGVNNDYYQYIWEGSWVSLGTTQLDLSNYYTKSETDTLLNGKVDKTSSANKVYGTNDQGAQTTYTVDDFYDGNIARRDSDGSITVPLTPTQNGHASSKKYVDDSFVFATNSEIDALFE
jgi:hypothetical protein